MANVASSSELRQKLLERLRRGDLQVPEQRQEARIEPAFAEEIPLSSGQQQIWLHSDIAPGAPIYNESITVRRVGPLDPAVMEAAFNEVVRRHAIWRTSFQERDGRIIQVVHPDVQVPLPLLDLTNRAPDAALAEALRIAQEDASRVFDPGQAPLLRARLVRLADEDYRLYLTFHHIVFDGVSIYRVFLPELDDIYRSFLAAQPSPLPELPIQYGDFATWQRKQLASGAYAAQQEYWRKGLGSSVPPVSIGVTNSWAAVPNWQAGMETFIFPARLSRAIRQLAAAEGATLYMTLLAAFHVLLYRYSSQPEIVTGAVVSTRNRSEIENLIGFLLNTVVLQSRPDASLSFRDFLVQIRDTVLGALANNDVPFETVVRELAPKRDSSRNALFQILFSLRPAFGASPEGWDLTEFDVHSGASGFELFIDIVDRPEALRGRIIYSSALFDRAAVVRVAEHLQTLLAGIVANPQQQIGLLPLLTDDEREAILSTGTGPSPEPPPATISGLFEERVAQHAERTAVSFEAQSLTYSELNELADAFASRLRVAGAVPGRLIAISVERSIEMLVALLAVLKTGAAYLPIDPGLPGERREFILGNAKPYLLVRSRDLEVESAGGHSSGDYAGAAYALYTSGSTGVPKGVVIPESAVVNFLRSMRREPGFSEEDVLLAITTLSFDIAVLEMFLPLTSGGKLVIAPRSTVTDPPRLIEAVRESNCTVMQGTPAVWRSLVDAGWKGSTKLKILCGGEALPRSLADSLLVRCGELWNMYGPTETTIWSTVQQVVCGTGPVPIGRPIDNTQVYVLDAKLQLVPPGVTGELYIGGDGVARGYIGRESLTEERFLPNRFIPGERMYRTGDLARWSSDGALEFLGRADHQVKIRGYRVELQEIEEALVKVPGIAAAAVKAWPDASGENALVAYFAGDADVNELREILGRSLPVYMIPARFIEMASLPLTPNAKVDRKALPAPDRANLIAIERGQGEPRTESERRVGAIWAELLNIVNPGPEDDFFGSGGHSLLAATLLRRIEAEFGQRLALSALFEHPTIARLAALLESHSCGEVRQRVLNWVYAGGYCRPLASYLSPEVAFHGVSLQEEIERDVTSSDTFESVAVRLVRELRAIQPKGPYYLGGWCVSGILAYSMAAELESKGEEVGAVVLLGAPNPEHYRSIPRATRLKSKLRHHWDHLSRLNLAEVPRYLMDRVSYQLQVRNPVESREFSRILVELAFRYKPGPLYSRVLLLQGADRPSVVDHAPGWAGLVKGEFIASDVPGNHTNCFEEPRVSALADELKKRLC